MAMLACCCRGSPEAQKLAEVTNQQLLEASYAIPADAHAQDELPDDMNALASASEDEVANPVDTSEVETFVAVVKRSSLDDVGSKVKIGLDLKKKRTCLLITRVKDGLAQQYNITAEKIGARKIAPGQRIIKVNAVAGDVKEMLAEAGSADEVTLTIECPKTK
eukprot:TRINITY_DN8632_c0_g1_i1.p1 TRINITY_DN8632_c0_g1~~TRINITY_DN8632_c0_g1_i1.p1  ORF type:complete len:186 (-),score=30.28 TRINITY_DN8632_c0_g1_i1:194-682(-)